MMPAVAFHEAAEWGISCRVCGEPATTFVEWTALRTEDSQTGHVVCSSEHCAAVAVAEAERWVAR